VPLVVRAIRMAKASRHDILLMVSTEDKEIAGLAEREGVYVLDRSPEDARDEVDLITVAKHSMEAMDAEGFRADIVVTIQPTAPNTPTQALDNALFRLTAKPDLDAVVCMSQVIGKHPFRMYSRVDDGQYVSFFPEAAEKHLQRQDREPAYQFTGGFYARRRRLLDGWDGTGFALGNWEGELVSPEDGIDIDTQFDLWLARAIEEHRE